jgi:Holliday junction resolvase RusA-like endonuclease
MPLPPNLITNRTAKLPKFIEQPIVNSRNEKSNWASVVNQGVKDRGVMCEKSGNRLRITIYGKPIGKPRMTQRDRWAKRPATTRYWEWCDRLRNGIAAAGFTVPPAETVAAVNWAAYFEPPKSWPKKKRFAAIGTLHRTKPDADNILKCADGLWPDGDAAIAAGTYRKEWDWSARLVVEIVVETGIAAEQTMV